MEAFRIEMAGAPVAVRCRFHENQAFFHDYFTEKEPLFTVEPTEADLRQMQADFDRMDEMEGISKHRRTESFLENNAIHSLLAERLVEQNVLLMHGSALCMDGKAYIFTAKSGTGKSVIIVYGKNAAGALCGKYAGSVNYNSASNAAVYNLVGVDSENEEIYGKQFNGIAEY